MKIGQVAKLLDMPVETIRFYEKNQILSPERKENSTYREFEVWEIFNLFECLGYRGYGFSVRDVKRIMKDASLQEITEMMNRQLEVICHKEDLLERQARELKELQQLIMTARHNIGKYWVEYSTRKVYVNCVLNINGRYEMLDPNNQVLRKWLGKAPFVKAGVLIDLDNLYDDPFIMQWVQSVKEEDIEFAGLNREEIDGCCLEEGLYLTTIINMGEKGSVSSEMFIPALEYVKKNGYQITGQCYGEIFLRNYEEDGWHRYLKLMIPIMQK